MNTASADHYQPLEQIFQDADAQQRRDAERLQQRREWESQRRARQELNHQACQCLLVAQERARTALQDLSDDSTRRPCIEALEEAGQALAKAKGPARLDTWMQSQAVPPPDTALGSHLLPLQFLIELLRLGERQEPEVIDAHLLRLPKTPALSHFVDWFEVAADALCGMEERGEAIRVPAPLPLPDNDCSHATWEALLRILHAAPDTESAVTAAESVCRQATDQAMDQAANDARQALFESPPTPAVGENEASMREGETADEAVATLPESFTAVDEPYVDGPLVGASVSGAEPCRYIFRREGDWWLLRFGEQERLLKDSRGLRYLARLLAEPDRRMHGVDLNPRRRERGAIPEPVSDSAARREYKQRYDELNEDMAAARRQNNAAEIEDIQRQMRELHRLVTYRDRLGNSPQRAAWRAVKSAIGRALRHVRQEFSELAAHLDKTIHLKYEPAFYSPQLDTQAVPIRWET